MNIRNKKAQAIQQATDHWQSISIGDEVIVPMGSPEKGIVKGIYLDPKGDYPIFMVDVPAYGLFSFKADDCKYELTVILHMDVEAISMESEVAGEIARSGDVKYYGTVADWETSRE